MQPNPIERLERQIKRLQRVTAMLTLGFLLLLIWRLLPGPETVEAREFLMRDEAGVVRGALMMGNGRPTLRLNDANGKARAMLFLYPDRGGVFRFTDVNTEHRLQLLLTREGSPELRIEGTDGRTRTRIGMTRGNSSAIAVSDEAGNLLWNAPVP